MGAEAREGVRVIGVDGGGSRTRAVALDGTGRPLGRREGPPSAVDPRQPAAAARVVVELVHGLSREAGFDLPAAALCAGLAGAGRDAVRMAVRKRIAAAEVADSVSVVTDGEAALHDAHGEGPGFLLVSGTGSVAWGRDESGRILRVGGWGALLGDEGSGYALGRAGLRAAARASDGRGRETALLPRLLAELDLAEAPDLVPWSAAASRSEVATLAPVVVAVAREGDRAARELVERSVAELELHVEALLRRTGPWEEEPELAMTGGLLASGGSFREAFRREVARLPVRVSDRLVDGARGAGRLALRAAGGD